ncbi:MAG: type II 3-dehydroquinate dehydratase [Candidatus Dormibacteria bacterium]|jgi:3-dehydroquinate dehydratase-2
MTRVLVLNGPNLGTLGRREPEIYGGRTLAEIDTDLRERAAAMGVDIRTEQCNGEGELIDVIEAETGRADALVINPGAYSHTSVALLDALRAFPGVIVEIHLTNTFQRESFRRVMLTAEAADSVILGLGASGYAVALEAAARIVRERRELTQ